MGQESKITGQVFPGRHSYLFCPKLPQSMMFVHISITIQTENTHKLSKKSLIEKKIPLNEHDDNLFLHTAEIKNTNFKVLENINVHPSQPVMFYDI